MELTILATSDLHGYILPSNFGSRQQDLPFGVAKVATILKEEQKKAQGPVILIENGDFIQGSPLSYYIAKRRKTEDPTDLMATLNTIGYDVGLLGNHEFNYGTDYLKKAIQAVNYPVICANILNEAGKPAFGNAYEIIEKEGVKIAILGLTTQYIPNWEHPGHIKGLTFKSIVETAKEYVPKLRQLADVVIVSYHGGFEKDLETGKPTEVLTGENEAYQLVMEVSGIDALITGHQHRIIATQINGVPVIQPGFRGEYVGEIKLDLEKNATGFKVKTGEASLIATGEALPDETIMKQIASISEEVEDWLDQPLGKVSGDMTIKDSNQARMVEHPYVEFIQKVQMAATGTDISGTALFNNEGKGFGEIITMRDVVTNYIYPNTLAVLNVSGADLKAALERSAAFFQVEKDGSIGINPEFINPKPQYYNYDMYEGVDYTINVKNPIGQRIEKLMYHGQPVRPTDSLEVTANQYRAVGGGDYGMYDASKIIREVQTDMTELIADYLVEHPVIEATTNQNFHVIID